MVLQVMTSVHTHPHTAQTLPAPHTSAAASGGGGRGAAGPPQRVAANDSSHGHPNPALPPATALLQNPDGSVGLISCPALVTSRAAASRAAAANAATATADMPEHTLRAAIFTAAYSDAGAQPYSLGPGVAANAAYSDADVQPGCSAAASAAHVDTANALAESGIAAAGYADYSLPGFETGECGGYSLTGRGPDPALRGALEAMSSAMRDSDRALVAAMALSDAQVSTGCCATHSSSLVSPCRCTAGGRSLASGAAATHAALTQQVRSKGRTGVLRVTISFVSQDHIQNVDFCCFRHTQATLLNEMLGEVSSHTCYCVTGCRARHLYLTTVVLPQQVLLHGPTFLRRCSIHARLCSHIARCRRASL